MPLGLDKGDRDFHRRLKAYVRSLRLTRGRLSKRCGISASASAEILRSGFCPPWIERLVMDGLMTNRHIILAFEDRPAGPGRRGR
jgi:hypothetical protein